MVKQRNPAMDVIRCFALLCVVSVHFFLNTRFYDDVVLGGSMFAMVCLRCFFMISVPLFLMLSGYLMCKKTVSREYYKKLLPILGIYVLASGVSALYKWIVAPEEITLAGAFLGLFSFRTARYSWYLELYLGLFLLIPYLNGMYQMPKSKKGKQILLFTIFLLTIAPGLFNIWSPFDKQWWLKPGSSKDFLILFPDHWVSLFPLMYYFLGSYLREYPLKLKALPNLALIVAVFFLQGAFNYYRSRGYAFVQGYWSDYYALPVVVQSVLIFTFFQNRTYSRMGDKTRRFLGYVSGLVFGAYLSSGVVDLILYPLLDKIAPQLHSKLPYFPLIVMASYVCSLLLSAVLNGIYDLFVALCRKCKGIKGK